MAVRDSSRRPGKYGHCHSRTLVFCEEETHGGATMQLSLGLTVLTKVSLRSCRAKHFNPSTSCNALSPVLEKMHLSLCAKIIRLGTSSMAKPFLRIVRPRPRITIFIYARSTVLLHNVIQGIFGEYVRLVMVGSHV